MLNTELKEAETCVNSVFNWTFDSSQLLIELVLFWGLFPVTQLQVICSFYNSVTIKTNAFHFLPAV